MDGPNAQGFGKWDYATDRPDDGPAKGRINKTQGVVKLERELYKDKNKPPKEGPVKDRLWDTFRLTQKDLLKTEPREELRREYMSVLEAR